MVRWPHPFFLNVAWPRTGRYLQGLMAMPMEMSSLGPACSGGNRGFSGTCEDRTITQKRWFLWTNPEEHVFWIGKSIEHLQCHRIYIQHIWRYGSSVFDTHFGMVPSGRVSQFRASSWGSHTGNSPRKTSKELDQTWYFRCGQQSCTPTRIRESMPRCYNMIRHSDFESLKNLTHI